MIHDWEGRKCEGLDIDFFFDAYEEDQSKAMLVDRLCMSCPAQQLCLATGVSSREWGVWGGVYLEDGSISREFNKHKSNEDWFNIWSSATLETA